MDAGLETLTTDEITLILLAASRFLQFRVQRYIPWRYWLMVVLISVAETQVPNVLTGKLKINLYVSNAAFVAVLTTTFAV